MSTAEQIRFLPFGDRRIAYALSGGGPPLVAAAWWVSHLELDWQDEAFRRFWEALAQGCTLVRYDRLGVGMSDREGVDAQPTAEGEVALLGRVLDELELERVTLLGGSSGGCTAISFAARFPERVERLLLYGAYAEGAAVSSPQVREAIITTVRSHWGLGSRLLADIFLGKVGAAERERFARYQRSATSAETAARLLELIYRTDVRAELALVQAPTLVVHRRSDPRSLMPSAASWRRRSRTLRWSRWTAAPIFRGPETRPLWCGRCGQFCHRRRRPPTWRVSLPGCFCLPASERCLRSLRRA